MFYHLNYKIIGNWIWVVFSKIIDSFQRAFMKGRLILENIALYHEIIHKYHLDKGIQCIGFKIDLSVVFDLDQDS